MKTYRRKSMWGDINVYIVIFLVVYFFRSLSMVININQLEVPYSYKVTYILISIASIAVAMIYFSRMNYVLLGDDSIVIKHKFISSYDRTYNFSQIDSYQLRSKLGVNIICFNFKDGGRKIHYIQMVDKKSVEELTNELSKIRK